MKRRQFILLLGGGSAGALSVGTGAFSSVDAERDVEVSVVEDDEAYLGLERLDGADSVRVGDETKVVRIQNQFAAPLDLSVVVGHKGGGIGEVDVDDPVETEETVDEEQEDEGGALQTGHEAHISVECDSPGDTSFTVSLHGVAGEASVDKTRTFSIHCEPEDDDATGSDTDSNPRVKFIGGSGKVRILTTGNNGGGGGDNDTVSAKLYCEDDDGNVSSSDGFEDVSVNEDLEIDDFDDDDLSGTIVGVEIEGIDGVYVKPDNAGEGSGNGNTVEDTTQDPDWD